MSLGKICQSSASHWDQFPTLSLHLVLLQGCCCHFLASKAKQTRSANAIQNFHCVPALCFSMHLLPAMFGADSRTALCGTSGESIYPGPVLYFTSSAHVSHSCEPLINKQVGITCTEQISLSLYYAQEEKYFSALFLQEQKYTESRQNT